MSRQLSHDPFARVELHKESEGITGECDWCGSEKKLFSFFLVRDDSLLGRRNPIDGRFCCVGCMRSYNS